MVFIRNASIFLAALLTYFPLADLLPHDFNGRILVVIYSALSSLAIFGSIGLRTLITRFILFQTSTFFIQPRAVGLQHFRCKVPFTDFFNHSFYGFWSSQRPSASVRVMNFLRDVIVDFTEADELTKLNAQMVAVDRILNIISVIISCVALTVKPSYCVWLILSSSVLATISQILRKRLYTIFIILRKKLTPTLSLIYILDLNII